jgi:hypothetical protein
MVNCKKLKARHSERTCIARQKEIAKGNKYGNGSNWGNCGSSCYNLTSCVGCAKGIRLFEQAGGKQ